MSLLGDYLPTPRRIGYRAVTALVVVATYSVLGENLPLAGVTGALFFVFTLAGDTAAVVIGDYADNVFLGLAVLGFTGIYLHTWLPGLLGGLAVGSWLLFDGVQHLRNDETRAELARPYTHDGGPLTGIPRALGARLLEPFRL
mgnify:CR=1 FL=1